MPSLHSAISTFFSRVISSHIHLTAKTFALRTNVVQLLSVYIMPFHVAPPLSHSPTLLHVAAQNYAAIKAATAAATAGKVLPIMAWITYWPEYVSTYNPDYDSSAYVTLTFVDYKAILTQVRCLCLCLKTLYYLRGQHGWVVCCLCLCQNRGNKEHKTPRKYLLQRSLKKEDVEAITGFIFVSGAALRRNMLLQYLA